MPRRNGVAVPADPQPQTTARQSFPDGFVWGAATSSYQIEGAWDGDGKGESIWDRFCATPGAIADGTDGRVACDHYHRYADDVTLMADLGLRAYRFSIAWPRVMPDGRGETNPPGLAFYDRLVDELLEAGITPFPTLYHWDLPQALQDEGGWTNRATAEAFADYAAAVVRRLGDRVHQWSTLNEPYVIANLGHLTGEHAPGHRDLGKALAASHHLLVAHGLAMRSIREIDPTAEVGIVINFTPVTPIGNAPLALDRQRVIDDFDNRWYTDPIAGKGYPAYTAERLGWDQSEVLAGDLDLIAAPIDFLGINYYTRQNVAAIDGERRDRGPETAMRWEIHPESLGTLLRDLHQRYSFPRMLITENGAAMPDTHRDDEGRVADVDRIGYLHDHLAQVSEAIAEGVPVEGYFAWSLLDNFEWAWGYGPKFGLVEVDLDTQERRPKQSALWYADLVRSGVLPPVPVPSP